MNIDEFLRRMDEGTINFGTYSAGVCPQCGFGLQASDVDVNCKLCGYRKIYPGKEEAAAEQDEGLNIPDPTQATIAISKEIMDYIKASNDPDGNYHLLDDDYFSVDHANDFEFDSVARSKSILAWVKSHSR